MYFEGNFERYLNDLAAKKPAPGGGSAAAAVGAMGVSLLSMVANFTIGKEKYKQVEPEIQEILSRAEKLRAELQRLIDEDVIAYRKVSDAYKMPGVAISPQTSAGGKPWPQGPGLKEALKAALEVPLTVCRNLSEAARLCEPLLEKGNVNLVSDVGVAAELIAAAFISAVMNVEINLASIEDKDLVSKIKAELYQKEKQVQAIRQKVVTQTREKIR